MRLARAPQAGAGRQRRADPGGRIARRGRAHLRARSRRSGCPTICSCSRSTSRTTPTEGIVRMEFLGGELLYAMRVKTHGRFNLCPSPVCNPDEGDGQCAVPAAAPTRPPVEFYPFPDVPRRGGRHRASGSSARRGSTSAASSTSRHRTAGASSTTSTPTRTCAPSVAAAFGFDPFERVVDFLEQEFEPGRNRQNLVICHLSFSQLVFSQLVF